MCPKIVLANFRMRGGGEDEYAVIEFMKHVKITADITNEIL